MIGCRIPRKLCWGGGVFLGILGLTFLGPLFGLDPVTIRPDETIASPSWQHWLGTDEMGRDLLARLSLGARLSLIIGIATALVSLGVGTLYGLLAAHWENRLPDLLLMRAIDILYSLPGLIVVILFTVFFGRSMTSLVLALALFSWPDTARIVRGEVIRLKREEFVEAFLSLGGRAARLARCHLIPNLAGLLILSATMTIPRAILTESTLSFLGLGVAPPLSSWGTMISDGWQMIRLAPHLLLVPSGLLLVTMLALNLAGDGLKERLFPKETV